MDLRQIGVSLIKLFLMFLYFGATTVIGLLLISALMNGAMLAEMPIWLTLGLTALGLGSYVLTARRVDEKLFGPRNKRRRPRFYRRILNTATAGIAAIAVLSYLHPGPAVDLSGWLMSYGNANPIRVTGNRISFDDRITFASDWQFSAALRQAEQNAATTGNPGGRPVILIDFESPGGSTLAAEQISKQIREADREFTVITEIVPGASCQSACSELFLSARPENRRLSTSSWLMIHQEDAFDAYQAYPGSWTRAISRNAWAWVRIAGTLTNNRMGITPELSPKFAAWVKTRISSPWYRRGACVWVSGNHLFHIGKRLDEQIAQLVDAPFDGPQPFPNEASEPPCEIPAPSP